MDLSYDYESKDYKRCLRLVDKENRTPYEQQRQTRLLINRIHGISNITGQSPQIILSKLEGTY